MVDDKTIAEEPEAAAEDATATDEADIGETDGDAATGPTSEPGDRPADDAKSADAAGDEEANNKTDKDGHGDDCKCDLVATDLAKALEATGATAGCRLVGISELLAKEVCATSAGPSAALDIGSDVIKIFKRSVEEIVTSADYAKRTGTHAIKLDLDGVSPMLAALALAALGGKMRL